MYVFQDCPTIVHRDGGTYLKLANKTPKSLEEVICSLTRVWELAQLIS